MLTQNLKPFDLPFEGMSMLPTLHPGDRLSIDPCLREDLKLGDLVAFYDQNEILVHRLILDKNLLCLKGDAALDIKYLSEVDFILGRVGSITRDKKTLSPYKKRNYYLRFSSYYSRAYPRILRQIYHLLNFFFLRKKLNHKK